jgi:hypothetical protein
VIGAGKFLPVMESASPHPRRTLPWSNYVEAMPGGSHSINRAVILLLGGLITAFYLCSSRSYFAGGAGSFLEFALAIASGQPTLAIVQRDIGYPVLLLLTGFPFTGSLVGVVAVQALMGFFMPLLVYFAVGRANPRAALIAALICIISLVPYQFIKMIYHDQLYMFLSLASAISFLWFIRSERPIALYIMTFAVLATSSTRPAALALLPALLIYAWMIRRGAAMHYIIVIALAVSFGYASYEYRRKLMGLQSGEPMPSYTGHQIFQNVYLFSRDLNIELSPSLGPAMRRLRDEIQKEFPDPANHPTLSSYRTSAPDFFKTALDFHDPDQFVRRVFERPNAEYYTIFHQIPAVAFDSNLFAHAFWEVVSQQPLYFIRYTSRNLNHYFFLPGYYFPRHTDISHQIRGGPHYPPQVIGNALEEAGLTERAVRELSYVPLEADFAALRGISDFVQRQFEKKYNGLNRIVLALSLIAFCYAILVVSRVWMSRRSGHPLVAAEYRRLAGEIIGLSGIVLYNSLITAAFVDPIHRYHYMIMPLEIICAGFGLRAIDNLMRTWSAPEWLARRFPKVSHREIEADSSAAADLRRH